MRKKLTFIATLLSVSISTVCASPFEYAESSTVQSVAESDAINIKTEKVTTSPLKDEEVTYLASQLNKLMSSSKTDISVEKMHLGPSNLVAAYVNLNLDGVTDSYVTVWITRDGKTVIPGDIYIADGQNAGINLTNVTNEAFSQANTSPDTKRVFDISENDQKKLALLNDAAGITNEVPPESAKRTAFIIFDPKCPHCKALYQSIQSLEIAADSAPILVKWIPVNLMDSLNYGAYILSGGIDALNFIENQQALPPVPPIHSQEAKTLIEKNTHIFTQAEIKPEVPYLLVIDNENNSITKAQGVPPAADLIKILGLQKDLD